MEGALPASAMSLIKNENPDIEKKMNQITEEDEKADYITHINKGLIEVRPKHITSTTTYIGQFPRRLLRFKEGQRNIVDFRDRYHQKLR